MILQLIFLQAAILHIIATKIPTRYICISEVILLYMLNSIAIIYHRETFFLSILTNSHRSIIVDDTHYERIGINISPKTIMALSSDNTPLMNCFSTETNKGSRIIHLSSYNLNKYINFTDDFLRYSHSDEYGCDLLAITTIINLLLFTNQLFHNSNHIEYKNIMPKLVINIMKYIANHLTDVITLENISRELHYSTNYISTQFKHHTGLTLRAYILDKRIENAKKLLLLGKNVSETCVLSGFNDYANFIRSFTKKTGISPGHYKAFIENSEN